MSELTDFFPEGSSSEIGDIVTAESAPDVTWLPADGAHVTQAAYPDLFSIIGISNAYNSGMTLLASPAELPHVSTYAVTFDSDATYLAVGNQSSAPQLRLYKRTGTTMTKLADPVCPSNVVAAMWSPNDEYLACSLNGGDNIIIYTRSGDILTAVTPPTLKPASQPKDVAWSDDSQYLCLAHTTTPYVTVYKRAGDVFTKLADPSPGLTAQGDSVTIRQLGNSTSYEIVVGGYDTLSRVTLINDVMAKSTLTSAGVQTHNTVLLSKEATHITVGLAGAPWWGFYENNGAGYTKLTTPASMGEWRPEGGNMTDDGLQCYGISGGSGGALVEQKGTSLYQAAVYPASGESCNDGSISADGSHFAAAAGAAPFMYVWAKGQNYDITTHFAVPSIDSTPPSWIKAT
jgi:hypothetical protein